MDALASHGVTVTNAGGIHAPGIAEQSIGNLLVFARNLHEAWRRKENNEWRHFQSHEFTGSTVTIVGLGSIGQEIATRLDSFSVETIGIRYSPEKGGPTDEVLGFDEDDIHEAFARSDYVVFACPLNDLTRGLVSEAEFATLPPNAVFVNAARGGIVDTDALVTALQSNAIRGAALDVTDPEPLPNDHPLWDLENCLITPHTGGPRRNTGIAWPTSSPKTSRRSTGMETSKTSSSTLTQRGRRKTSPPRPVRQRRACGEVRERLGAVAGDVERLAYLDADVARPDTRDHVERHVLLCYRLVAGAEARGVFAPVRRVAPAPSSSRCGPLHDVVFGDGLTPGLFDGFAGDAGFGSVECRVDAFDHYLGGPPHLRVGRRRTSSGRVASGNGGDSPRAR